MEHNDLASIAKNLAISEQTIAGLGRAEKLSLRNQIVIAMIGTGRGYEEIGEMFHLKERQVRNIVNDAYEAALSWHKDLPSKIRIAAFKMNVADIFGELITMKKIRNTTSDEALKFDMTEKIALLQIKYDKMLSDGPTLDKIKEQGEKLETLIVEYQLKVKAEQKTMIQDENLQE